MLFLASELVVQFLGARYNFCIILIIFRVNFNYVTVIRILSTNPVFF